MCIRDRDSEMNQQVFILDLSFNPEITDELMVIYFDLNKEDVYKRQDIQG